MADDRVDVVFVVTAGISTMFVAPIADELVRRGLKVAIVANMGAGANPGPVPDDSVQIHSLPFRRRPSPLLDLVHLIRLSGLLLRLRPRVVHASTPKGGLLGVLAGRATRRPVVVYQARGLRSENIGGATGAIQRLLERCSTSLARDVIVNSASLREAMVLAGVLRPGKGTVIGSGGSVGVDTVRFSPASSPEEAARFTVGYIGRIHPDKGLGDLVLAFDAVREVRPDARLLLVGDWDEDHWSAGDHRHDLQRQLRESRNVEVTGFVADVVPYLRRMNVMVFPSSREGLPNAPLEAQACGVPVVAYRVTGVVDALEDGVGGILVEPGDEVALAAATVRVATDRDLARQMGVSGRRFVAARFERTTVVEAHADFLQQAAGLDDD